MVLISVGPWVESMERRACRDSEDWSEVAPEMEFLIPLARAAFGNSSRMGWVAKRHIIPHDICQNSLSVSIMVYT